MPRSYPHSHKSHSHKSHSSSSSSTHRSSSSSSHDSYSTDHKSKRLSSQHRQANSRAMYDIDMDPLAYAAQKERAAKEASKKASKARSHKHGPSSSRLDKEQRRKMQNRDSSRASDAGKRAHMEAMKDIYAYTKAEEATKEKELQHYRKVNETYSNHRYDTMSWE